MEKCTFCVQRIRHGTNAARDRGDRVKDGDVTPACAQTCPTNAITFGDLNDPESQVAELFKNARSYAVLEDLNTQPRVRYATRIRNAARSLPEGESGEETKKPSQGAAGAAQKEGAREVEGQEGSRA